MRTLLIDNHDSFTYNLFQLLAEVNGVEPIVVRNDEASWAELGALAFDNIVISPGPGRPDRPRDFGVCADVLAAAEVPLLGVCLGHQGLAWAHGGRVVPAPEPFHGRLSTVRHTGEGLFAGLPEDLRVVRYHSLSVAEPLPAELEATAWTADGVVMALAHRTLPRWGVQFHPESVCTDHGRRLLDNFRALTALHGGRARAPRPVSLRSASRPADGHGPSVGVDAAPAGLELRVRRLDVLHDPERAFAALYGDSRAAFWLDSSVPGERARFSFIGAADGPLGATVTYDVAAGEVVVSHGGRVERARESIFDHLARETRRMRPTVAPDEPLPFDLDCGFVGYLGYELKAECGGEARHRSELPDAAFVRADRVIAFDLRERRTYLVCLTDRDHAAVCDEWLDATAARLAALEPLPEPDPPDDGPVRFEIARARERYLDDIAACRRHLGDGESYEVCLTNRITAAVAPDPLAVYRRLRRANPAPFAAYLRFGDTAVLSSSPERFLAVGRDRWAEARPIKGTAPRGATPAEDARLAEALRAGEKSRAENLMICDLLRNDLGSVCQVGTVHVPSLMAVESYETVHQLVSTVRGLLRDDVDAAHCARACFPPGSMTGAPKERTLEILDELEGGARGVYSGAIGYFGTGGGCDLSVVIRTLVLDGSRATLGVGGAIVAQSDPEREFDEILVKAAAPMRALDPAADPWAAFAREPAAAPAASTRAVSASARCRRRAS